MEKRDDSGALDVAKQAATRIQATAEKVGAGRVMVYPYAHLSSDLAKPRIASEIVDKVFEQLHLNQDLETAGKAWRSANTPRLLSRRPIFVG